MKNIIVLLTLVLGMNAFAGPEDHMANQTCYDVQTTPGQYVPMAIPREICLEQLSIDPWANQITVHSYFQSELLFKGLKLTSLIRRNEDYFDFKASNVIFNQWNSGCGEGERTQLMISGLVDFAGESDVRSLHVTAEDEVSNDICHSQSQTTVFTYHVR